MFYLSLALVSVLFILFLHSRVSFYTGSENFLEFSGFKIEFKKIIRLFKGRGKRTRSSKLLRYFWKFSPSPRTFKIISQMVIRESERDLFLSTADPFWDGILSGVKYAFGMRNFHPGFALRPFFIFRAGGRLILFVKIGFIWIIDIIRKEVENVLHRGN